MNLFALASGMMVPIAVALMLLVPLLARRPRGQQETNWPTGNTITILFVVGLELISFTLGCIGVGGFVGSSVVMQLALRLIWVSGIGGVGCIAGAIAIIVYSRARYGPRTRNT